MFPTRRARLPTGPTPGFAATAPARSSPISEREQCDLASGPTRLLQEWGPIAFVCQHPGRLGSGPIEQQRDLHRLPRISRGGAELPPPKTTRIMLQCGKGESKEPVLASPATGPIPQKATGTWYRASGRRLL